MCLTQPIAFTQIRLTTNSLRYSHELDESEHVTNLECVSLRSQETTSGQKSYIAVSCLTAAGEDQQSKGKVSTFSFCSSLKTRTRSHLSCHFTMQLYMFEVIDVVPEPGRPQSNRKLKPVYAKQQK